MHNNINDSTHFFDWLISDFKSVLYILTNINNKDLLLSDHFTNKWIYYNRNSWVVEH